MMLQFFIICALLFNKGALTQQCRAENQYPWSYHGDLNGPDDWEVNYPDCFEKNQSPIEFKSEDILTEKYFEPQYNGFDTPITKATVANLGWTVMVTPEDDVNRYIQWGKITFTFDEIHFHFGTASDPGAEHVIDGTRYEMEIHFVTHRDNNDVAVFASLMQATNDQNSGFDPIIEVFSKIQYRNDATKLESDLNLVGLLPQNSRSYYYYVGSNSIPPCQPEYEWFVFKDIGEVGNDQLDEFMTLYSVGKDDASDSCRMGENYRPVQDRDIHSKPINSIE